MYIFYIYFKANINIKNLIFDKKKIMAEASAGGTFKVIIYIVLFYYLFKFAMKLLAPYLLRKVAQKAQDHLKKQMEQQQAYQNQQNKTNQNKTEDIKKSKKEVGEYIDYEEVE
jgi:hypothetical protein